MSAELLRHLADEYAFDSTPSFVGLGAYHVPFDHLLATAAVERRLAVAVHRGERVAIVASSGSGKSSVVAHVLGPTVDGVAPIVVPIRAVQADGGATPGRVADELLAMLRRYADEALELTDDQRRRAADAAGDVRRITRSHSRTGGVALALPWLGPALGREITRQTEHIELIGLREKTEVVEQLLAAIAADDLRPVLVFDDSDRWLGSTEVAVVRGFFGDVVRWAADLPAAIVVAVHDRYFEHVPRTEVLTHLDTPVDLPRLEAADQLATILDHRIRLHTAGTPFEGAESAHAFDPGAIAALFGVYTGGGSLRRVIQLCHVALIEAVEQVAPARITAADVLAASNAG